MTDLSLVGQLVAWALAAALGVFTCEAIVGKRSFLPPLVLFAIAPGTGFAIASLLWFFIWCRGGSGSPLVPVSAEFGVLLLLLWRRRRSPDATVRRQTSALQSPVAGRVRLTVLLVGATLLAEACAAVYFVRFLKAGPYAGWDAWAIWNLHARALVLGGGRFWKSELYKVGWSHPDYPLLLPLTVARLWLFAGREVLAAPAFVAGYFTLATAVLLGGTLQRTKGPVCAALAFIAVLASREFLWVGLQEYADVPLSFYVLLAFCCVILASRLSEPRLLLVAGLAAGLAAWTKNEGLTFLLCFLAAHLVMAHWRRGAYAVLSDFGRLLAGCALPLAAVVAYKRRVPGQNDVLSWLLTRAGWLRACDAHRLRLIATSFGDTLWHLDTWLFLPSVLVLVLFLAIVGVDKCRDVRRSAAMAAVTFFLLFLVYFAVYATSPSELTDYMESSLSRLYIQIWPAFVLHIFLLARELSQDPRQEGKSGL